MISGDLNKQLLFLYKVLNKTSKTYLKVIESYFKLSVLIKNSFTEKRF